MVKEAFTVNDTLNKKLFDTETKRLLPEVREALLKIVESVKEFIEVPIDIVDVQLVGSNASFNYTDSSDLDVHLIADFDNVANNEALVQRFYNMKALDFNSKYFYFIWTNIISIFYIN